MSFGQPLLVLKRVDSTNNYAANMLRSADVAEGTVVMAHEQTEGRGQRGTSWSSDRGDNLLFSLVLKPSKLLVSQQFAISQKISLGIVNWLQSEFGIDARIKWPNDLLVNNYKIGGMLIENGIRGNLIDYSIVGVGLNVNQLQFDPKFNATSLRALTATHFEPKELLEGLLAHLEKAWLISIDQNLEYKYVQHLMGWKSVLKYRDEHGIFSAQVAGLGPYGQLVLKRADGSVKSYGLKEVELLRESL